ncbi:hypothetical protein C8J57DRAFT_1500008 [Mycena rebaudengoi]|nr:hypothetical protein C8J57DRAFT_1500008 [Mycena rebaudengoi]
MFSFEFPPPPASKLALKAQNRDSDVPSARPSFLRAFYRLDARILEFLLVLVLRTLHSRQIPICGTQFVCNAFGASVMSLTRLLRVGRVSCQLDAALANWTRLPPNLRDSRQLDAPPAKLTRLPRT